MKKNNQTGNALRSYVQPSLRFFHVGIHIPVCVSAGATTEDYIEDDVFGGND